MNVIIANKNKDLLNSLNIDVIQRLDGEFTADEIIRSFSTFFYNKMFLDITAIKDYKDINNIQKLSMNMDMDKVILLLDNDPETGSPAFLSKIISLGIYNFTRNKEGLMYLYSHTNTYRDVAHIHQLQNSSNQVSKRVIEKQVVEKQRYILGFKNLTTHAGATSLIYMIKKTLSDSYNTLAIEVNKKDFMYFHDPEMISTTSNELGNILTRHSNKDIILIDLNDSNNDSACNDVIYLIEPSTIKLNRMILINRRVFESLNNKKVVLNKSLLSSKDVNAFEFESGSNIFYNLPPLNDKEDNSQIILPFLNKLGLIQTSDTYQENDNKKFSLFKF